jgi:hypothetical protein
MQKELSYLNAEGNTVFTSRFLKNRGTCCKTACLHCPFGFTIKKLGLQFRDIEDRDRSLINEIMAEAEVSLDFEPFWPANVKLVVIKDTICGFILKNHIVVKHLVLKPHFQHQGISKELVESYFFI